MISESSHAEKDMRKSNIPEKAKDALHKTQENIYLRKRKVAGNGLVVGRMLGKTTSEIKFKTLAKMLSLFGISQDIFQFIKSMEL